MLHFYVTDLYISYTGYILNTFLSRASFAIEALLVTYLIFKAFEKIYVFFKKKRDNLILELHDAQNEAIIKFVILYPTQARSAKFRRGGVSTWASTELRSIWWEESNMKQTRFYKPRASDCDTWSKKDISRYILWLHTFVKETRGEVLSAELGIG